MKISKIFLIISALVYFVFGFLFFINPDVITDMDGIILPDRPAANHIRAVLGGMEIGLGMILLWFCFVKNGVKNGLIVLALSIGITALSRLYGIVLDSGGDKSNVISFIAELSFALIAIILYRIEAKNELN